MKIKEFNLSKWIYSAWILKKGTKVIPTENVKEFIRREDELLNDLNSGVFGIYQYHDQYGECKGKDCLICKILNRIDKLIEDFEDKRNKLAGEKLSK